MTLIERRIEVETRFREALAKEERIKKDIVKWRYELRLLREEERAEYQELMFQSA